LSGIDAIQIDQRTSDSPGWWNSGIFTTMELIRNRIFLQNIALWLIVTVAEATIIFRTVNI